MIRIAMTGCVVCPVSRTFIIWPRITPGNGLVVGLAGFAFSSLWLLVGLLCVRLGWGLPNGTRWVGSRHSSMCFWSLSSVYFFTGRLCFYVMSFSVYQSTRFCGRRRSSRTRDVHCTAASFGWGGARQQRWCLGSGLRLFVPMRLRVDLQPPASSLLAH